MPAHTIETPRLSLVLMSDAFMRAAVERRPLDMAAELGGARIPPSWPDGDEDFLQMRLADLAGDPTRAHWLGRAIVLREAGEMVGHAGFHGPPDERGFAEVGYTVFEPHRRSGYAEEAVRGLMAWAAGRGAAGFRASVSPGNEPSLRLVAKLGLVEVGSHVDPVDGLELVFERET